MMFLCSIHKNWFIYLGKTLLFLFRFLKVLKVEENKSERDLEKQASCTGTNMGDTEKEEFSQDATAISEE